MKQKSGRVLSKHSRKKKHSLLSRLLGMAARRTWKKTVRKYGITARKPGTRAFRNPVMAKDTPITTRLLHKR